MSKKVVHHQLGIGIAAHLLTQDEFPDQVRDLLNIFIEQARDNFGATVDWTTLRVNQMDPIEVRAMDGSTSTHEAPLEFMVDSVEIHEAKSDGTYRYPDGAQV